MRASRLRKKSSTSIASRLGCDTDQGHWVSTAQLKIFHLSGPEDRENPTGSYDVEKNVSKVKGLQRRRCTCSSWSLLVIRDSSISRQRSHTAALISKTQYHQCLLPQFTSRGVSAIFRRVQPRARAAVVTRQTLTSYWTSHRKWPRFMFLAYHAGFNLSHDPLRGHRARLR